MTDEIDHAADEAERYLSEALRQRKPEAPGPTGRCLFCDEIVGDTQRFCDAECRDMWDRERKQGRR
jgi:hypothetical protein